jgi:archaellum biogenesis protein FlaJ (TadC family)
MSVVDFDIYASLASSIKKTLKIILMSKFICGRRIKEIIYETYLPLTLAYGAVILD